MKNIRYRIADYLLRRGGVERGMLLPWWGHVLVTTLFPGRILIYMAARVWDYSSFCVKIEGIKIEQRWLLDFKRCKKPTPWMRCTDIVDGVPVLEFKDEVTP